MPTHWGATLGLVGSLLLTVKAYREDGWFGVKRSWTGLDSNYPGEIFWDRIEAPIPLVVGGGATLIAVKTGFNNWTPKGLNV
jgi:hypothetical protein